MAAKETVGLMLIRRGLVTRDQLYAGLKLQRENGKLLGTCLMELGFVDPKALLDVLADQMDIPPLPRGALRGASKAAVTLVPPGMARRLKIVPYSYDGDILGVALADGRSLEHLHEVAEVTGLSVGAYLVLEDELDHALEEHFGKVEGKAPMASMPLAGRSRPVRVSPLKELPSRSFGEALGLEATSAPVVLLSKKSEGGGGGGFDHPPEDEMHIARDPKDFTGIQIAEEKEFTEAIDGVFSAKDSAGIASNLVSALLTDFERAAVFSTSHRRLTMLAFHGLEPGRAAVSQEALPEVMSTMSRRNISYGMFVEDPRGEALADVFEFTPGKRCLFAPILADGDHWLVYADVIEDAAPEDLHQVEIALKETETAVSLLLGFR